LKDKQEQFSRHAAAEINSELIVGRLILSAACRNRILDIWAREAIPLSQLHIAHAQQSAGLP